MARATQRLIGSPGGSIRAGFRDGATMTAAVGGTAVALVGCTLSAGVPVGAASPRRHEELEADLLGAVSLRRQLKAGLAAFDDFVHEASPAAGSERLPSVSFGFGRSSAAPCANWHRTPYGQQPPTENLSHSVVL